MRVKFNKRRPAPAPITAKFDDPLSDLFNADAKVSAVPADAAEPAEAVEETGDVHPHLLATATDALRYMQAGKATVTFKSCKTGTRFTYRISAPRDDEGKIDVSSDMRFVALLNGSDNESSYQYFGFLRRGVFFFGKREKVRVSANAPSARAFKWVWKQLQSGRNPGSVMEIWHEGHCGKCGRKLTVPESIRSGIGPECAARMGLV